MTLWTVLLACSGQETLVDTAVIADTAVPPAADVKPVDVPATNPLDDALNTSSGPIVFYPDTHGTLRIDVAGTNIWVDPWTKAGLQGFKADLILITDNHFDHLDTAAIEAVRKPGTVVVAPPVVAAELAKANLPDLPVTVMKNGEKTEILGIKFEAIPMYNLVRGPEEGGLFHDKGRGNGYILEFGNGRVYIAGDTECTDEMKALTDINVAFVPMNLPYTRPPAEAAACVTAFKPKVVYPYHYFGSDLSEFETPVATAGIEVRKREWYPKGSPF